MRNWDDSEVRDLKDLPVTNVPFDPSERVQVRMAAFGFYTDHRMKTGRSLSSLYFPRHHLREKTPEVWGQLYGTGRPQQWLLGGTIFYHARVAKSCSLPI